MARKNRNGRPRPQNRPQYNSQSGKSCTYYDKPRYTHVNKYADQKGRTKAKPYVEVADDGAADDGIMDAALNELTSTDITAAPVRTSKKMFESLKKAPLRWEVWFAELGDHYGTNVQSGCRPVIILSNDVSNRLANTVTVLPMTTRRKHLELPSHVCVEAADCVPLTNETLNASLTLIEQITTLDKSSLMNLVCRIDSQTVKRRIEEAILYYIGVSQQWSGDSANNAPEPSADAIPDTAEPIPPDTLTDAEQEVQHGSRY